MSASSRHRALVLASALLTIAPLHVSHGKDKAPSPEPPSDGHRTELEAFERLSAELRRSLTSPRTRPTGRRRGHGTQQLLLRDRLPAALQSPPAKADPRGVKTPTDPHFAPELTPGLLAANRYDLPVVLNREVSGFIQFFTGRGKQLFARWLARMGRYEAETLRVLEKHGLPRDLIYLALIESGYNPMAVSRAGAEGIWQFMGRTGAEYGLRQDFWIDERRDPEASTEAACNLLKDLYGHFRSWELAMAAYNGGIGLLSSAVKRYNTNEFWTLARYDYLPSGSRVYVAKVLAAVIVGRNRKAFGFDAIVPEQAEATQRVQVRGGTKLSTVARASGASEQTLARLNPQLRRGVTPPGKEAYPILLPATSLTRFTERFDRLSQRNRQRYLKHSMRFGETLKQVATAYGTSIRAIMVLNRLSSQHQAKAGQTVIVPVPANKRRRKPSAPKEPQTVVMPPLHFVYPDRNEVFFRVPDRSFSTKALAQHLDMEPADIAMWNGLDPDARLHQNMVLRLYLPTQRPTTDILLVPRAHLKIVEADSEEFQAAQNRASRTLKSKQSKRRRHLRTHTVRQGDTLSKIARRYRTTVKNIVNINRIRPDRLRIGQRLQIRPGRK